MASKMNMDDGIAEGWDVKLGMKMEVDFALMRKGKIMFKVPNGQDPYSAIGKYIRDHITAIEDIIAVIKINEVETNQLFMVDTNEENYFIWETDWWEGEENVTLIDFFPVSEAQRANQSVQSADTISRRAAIAEIARWIGYIDEDMINRIQIGLNRLPSAQPTEASCWGCNCQKMERLKEQKTFSEMVHLHDAETHEERTETHACDLISRQDAIDALDEQIEQCNKSLSSFDISMKDEYAVKVERASLVAFRETLEYLPSAEPKRGKWIYCEDSIADGVDGYRCDQCGFFVPWDYTHKSIDYIKDYNFCPKCGSYNGGEQDG